MQKFKITIFFLTISLLSINCSKEKWPRIKYEVNTNSTSEIAYTMTSGSINYETVSGNWSTSFRGRQGNMIFLSATHTALFGNTTIRVFINGELSFIETTNMPGQIIAIQEIIP
jgi:hypothetical protein